MALSSEEKKKYMQLAFAEAKKAQRQGEVPIGAILIDLIIRNRMWQMQFALQLGILTFSYHLPLLLMHCF